VSDAFKNDIRINAKGLTIFPGLIDAHCHLGCFEDGVGALGFHTATSLPTRIRRTWTSRTAFFREI
jgi:imidazolonepropionase-like amidohydrolase